WALVLSYLAVGIVTVNHIGTLWLFWTGVAAVARGSAVTSPIGRSVSRVLVAIPIGVAVMWTLAAVPAFAATRSGQTSAGYVERGRYDLAVAAGREAVTADSARAIYWHYFGVAYTRQLKFATARDAFLNAWKR